MTEPSEQSQELARVVVENVHDFAVYAKDFEGRVLSWNPGVGRLLGYAEDEWVGRHASIIFTPEDLARGELVKEMQTALARGRSEDTRWHVRRDGTRFFANGLLMLLRDGSGTPRAFAKILRDDTARHVAEEEFRAAKAELERRVEERTRGLSLIGETLLTEVKERRAAGARVRGLLRRVVEAQELERGRIARDLHDNLGQELTALKLNLELLKAECGARPELVERIEKTHEIARRVEDEMDFISWELRPAALDQLGLPAAVKTFAREWSKHYGVGCDFHAGAGRTIYPGDGRKRTRIRHGAFMCEVSRAGLCGGSPLSLLQLTPLTCGFDFAPRRHVGLMLRAPGEAVVTLRHLHGTVVPVPAPTFDVRRRSLSPRVRGGDLSPLLYHWATIRLL